MRKDNCGNRLPRSAQSKAYIMDVSISVLTTVVCGCASEAARLGFVAPATVY